MVPYLPRSHHNIGTDMWDIAELLGNEFVILKVLGANAWYRLSLLTWEAWGVLAISMLIAIPLAWGISIFFLVPDPNLSLGDLELSTLVSLSALSVVSLASATIYSRRLGLTTVKDLKP